jgi:predicted Zn-dependent protease
MILSESDAKQLTQRVLKLSKADSCVVGVAGHERGNIRMALNRVTTSGLQDNLSVSITSNFGKRSGSVSINEFDDASIQGAVKKSEEIARLAPEDPEFQEPLGPQKYLESKTYFESTAQARPEKLAALARPLVEAGMAQQLTGAGYLQAGTQCSALATSKGLFVYEKSTGAVCTYSARTSDGTGSGWVGGNQHDIDRLQTGPMAKIAVEKAFQSRNQPHLRPENIL